MCIRARFIRILQEDHGFSKEAAEAEWRSAYENTDTKRIVNKFGQVELAYIPTLFGRTARQLESSKNMSISKTATTDDLSVEKDRLFLSMPICWATGGRSHYLLLTLSFSLWQNNHIFIYLSIYLRFAG